ncbi:Phytochelatins synthase [Tieghemostelium lacteum]|uniref:glutathione gamma-glutamylcysteinyltransferase n=1 Tax=Tieghemostelium lacteum TaxID=361077 RepID=A0A151ZJ74_TIELA|nr:Phytochelatins synthase [Tieghemostelium lacteum]|eukprot:KYQ94006.1 Phytochelatins synthase [Tieghemostelium lacteum]
MFSIILKQPNKSNIIKHLNNNINKSLKCYYSTQCSTCSIPLPNNNNTQPTTNNNNNNNILSSSNNSNSILSQPTISTTTTTIQNLANIQVSKEKPLVSFYKRNLPSHLVEFSSDEGKKIFKESLESGYMEGYFSLAEQFVSQSDPAYCGLASLAMVLNSLKIDPKRLWKGPWRWFAEDMLDCCIPIESVKQRGVSFTEFSCLSRCNGANIHSIRAEESDISTFRDNIKEACSKTNTHLVMSYSRKVLGQTGVGHYSPIGGYNPQKDLALVLDVARFKYSPHWVPVQVLWDSMTELNTETKKSRGYFLLSGNPSYTPSFCRTKNTLSWSSVADKYLNSDIPQILSKMSSQANIESILEILFKNLPTETPYVLCAYSHELHNRLSLIEQNNEILSQHQHALNQPLNFSQFFKELSKSKSFNIIQEMVNQNRIHWKVSHQHDLNTPKEICHEYPIHLATLMFLALPSHLFNKLSIDQREQLRSIRNLDYSLNVQVINEIMKIREEMFQVSQSPCECSPEQQIGCLSK